MYTNAVKTKGFQFFFEIKSKGNGFLIQSNKFTEFCRLTSKIYIIFDKHQRTQETNMCYDHSFEHLFSNIHILDSKSCHTKLQHTHFNAYNSFRVGKWLGWMLQVNLIENKFYYMRHRCLIGTILLHKELYELTLLYLRYRKTVVLNNIPHCSL